MALNFSGDSDRLIVNDASFLIGLSALTFSCWIKCNATLPYDIGFFKTNDTWGSDNGIGMRYDASGFTAGGSNLIKAGITINDTEYTIESSSSVQTNDWQFVLMRWESGDEIDLFIDGQQNSLSASSGTISGTTGSVNIDEILFGTGAKGSATTGWNGLMEDVRFYDRKLTEAEIETLYHIRGNDNIIQNLIFRVLFNELPIGQVPSASDISDLTGNLNIDTVTNTPTYSESPGFASRRKNRH